MSVTTKTIKMLWGRAASRCAICRQELVYDSTETDDESVVGDICHIVAESVDGPRGQSVLTLEQRNKYSNLVLLCKVHHKQVDDQPNEFSVDKLHEIKNGHEQWVKNNLDFDELKQRDDEIYAGYVDHWENTLNIDEWKSWTSWLLSADQPRISISMKNALDEIRPWILSRIWPGRYPALEKSFTNFRHVAQDLVHVFNQHAIKFGEDLLSSEKFYKIEEWDPEKYRQLSLRYESHVDLIEDLTLELTRAANYICDKIRETLMHSYRINSGALLVESGPNCDFEYITYRVEYRGDERTEHPYPGLQNFDQVRFDRDLHFGKPGN